VSWRTGSAVWRSKSWPARAYSSFRWSLSSVIVPDRASGAVRTGLVWSMAMAGGTPSTRSTAGLVHAVEELARVGAEGLDVATLALGVEGVEDQAGLARAARARDHGELAGADVQVEVLEVVLARAADADQPGGHGTP
jgi:hypothetical protein